MSIGIIPEHKPAERAARTGSPSAARLWVGERTLRDMTINQLVTKACSLGSR